MSKLIGNAVFGQSGGPTSVINASAAGVFTEALRQTGVIEKVYGAANGIVGILNEKFYDIGQEDPAELELLKTTPSSALGSCRYKLADPDVDDTDYKRILEVFRKHNIRYFFYNGGNDSMDTCNKISKFMQKAGYDCRVMGVPKTVDNDLYGTDHCPGFASAAKYIATTCMEVYLDARVYDTGMITVIEIMGRNAGWLAASAALASYKGYGPDLIYLPEVDFDIEKMLEDIRRIYEKEKKVIVAVSEGVKTREGKYIPELVGELRVDAFGHKQMGGTASVLADYLRDKIDCKVRAIEFSLMQRCAAHLASLTDVEEAFLAGQTAVRCAVDGMTDLMVGFQRPAEGPYQCEINLVPLSKVANTEKKVPRDWINDEGNFVNQQFIDYALPLIQGESKIALEDGLPRFANLKKVPVTG
ncbi:MAG: 6-phosphofructokinase [Saccharofermentanales bacterium]|jgi:6-phosphofructokinase